MKNILFDLDGTLTDPEEGILNCIEYALEKLGAPVPERSGLKKYIGPPLWESFMELLGTDSREEANRAVLTYRERFTKEGMFENRPYDGMHEMLGELRGAGFNLYVCTSKPGVFARQIAEHFSFDGYFNNIYGSGLDGSMVEKSDLIAHILTTESIKPGDAGMIGDRRYDINGALNNNVSPYGVSYGFGIGDELKDALRIFDSPLAISSFFRNL